MRFNDLMELKNDTARKNAIRERISKLIYQALVQEFGDEYTLLLAKEAFVGTNASKVAKNTVVADVGDVKDKSGFDVGAVVEITVKVKSWNDTTTKNDTVISSITLDDYRNEGD